MSNLVVRRGGVTYRIPGSWAIMPGDALAHWWVKIDTGEFGTPCSPATSKPVNKFIKPFPKCSYCHICRRLLKEWKEAA